MADGDSHDGIADGKAILYRDLFPLVFFLYYQS